MSGRTSVIPFPFAPVPRRSFADVRSGALTPAEHRVEAFLYSRANQETWTTSVRNLDTIALGIAWEHSLDYLSKVLRSLRDKRRIDYTSRPGSTRHGYVFLLLFEPHGLSEHGPSSNAAAGPSRDDVRRGSASALEATSATHGSEERRRREARTNPSRTPSGPSSERGASVVQERDSAASSLPPVRAPRDVVETTTNLSEERRGGEQSRFEQADDVATLLPEVAEASARGRALREGAAA